MRNQNDDIKQLPLYCYLHVIYFNWQVLGAVAAGLAATLQGACFTYPTRALPKLQQDPDFQLNSDEVSWFGKLSSSIRRTFSS